VPEIRLLPLSSPYLQLLEAVALELRITRKLARQVVEGFHAELAEMVWARGRVIVPGLGVFKVRARKARSVMRPPSTPAADRGLMQLPADRSVRLLVAKHWRRRSG